MGKIARLPPDLADQIAAGEVVERPASVIKELVENAVDAGARRVAITVEQGGKRLIRVEDDGEGMDAEDARLAVERHATSKIRTSDDLGRIATLGFRGEALPAVASVSHFTLRTRQRDATGGVEVAVDGGAPASVREVGAPAGTVGRSPRPVLQPAGAAQVPEVGRGGDGAGHAGRDADGAVLRGRRVRARGARAAPARVSARRDAGPTACSRSTATEPIWCRWSGAPAGWRSTAWWRRWRPPCRAGPQHVFVNRRMVRDKTIAHAIGDAYSAASIKERSPEVHLFIEMPLDAVDVNVHPTKAEVRFRDQAFLHSSVRMAVADALSRAPVPGLTLEAAAAPAVAARRRCRCPCRCRRPIPRSFPAGGRAGLARRGTGGAAPEAGIDDGLRIAPRAHQAR